MEYKYYLIKNEVNLNGSDSDEPLWLRDKTTDVYKHWVRFGALSEDKTTNGKHYTVIASDIDLKEKDSINCLEIIDLETARSYNAILHPPREYEEKIPDGFNEYEIGGVKIQEPKYLFIHLTKPTPDLEKDTETRFKKEIYGIGQNHTGNTGTETWALANSPHHLTGTCTIQGTLTIEAGCQIIYDGNYKFTITTGNIISNGNTSTWIYYKSNSANQGREDYATWLEFSNASRVSQFSYCDVQNCAYVITTTTAIPAMTFSHLKIHNFRYGFTNALGTAITINNSKIYNISAAMYINSSDFIWNDCEFIGDNTAWHYSGGGGGTLNQYNRCYFNGQTNTNYYSTYLLLTDCYLYKSYMNSGASAANRARTTHTRVVFYSSAQYMYGTDCSVVTGSKFIKSRPGGAGGVSVGIEMNTSYIAGGGTASWDNVDTTPANAGPGNVDSAETPSQFYKFYSWDGGVAVDPISVVPTSISVTAIGANQVTINSVTTQYCKMRIYIGTVSGVYDDYFEFDVSPTNLSGQETLFAKIHTNIIKHLKEGTTYFYALKGIGYMGLEESPLSAEGDFTTTAVPRVQQLDVTTNKITYNKGELLTVSCSAKVDSNVVGANVFMDICRKSDDATIDTLVMATTNFTANVVKDIAAEFGPITYAVSGLVDGTEYYIKVRIFAGTPAIDETLNDSIATCDFSVVAIRIEQLDIITDSVAYETSGIITITGNVKIDSATVNTNVLIELRKKSDNSLKATLMNKNYSFTANTVATINTINGGALTTSTADADEYYVKITLSGGTPVIDATLEDNTATADLIVKAIIPKILQLDINTPDIAYGSGDTINVNGNVKSDRNITAASVLIEVRLKSDDSLIATLLNTTTNLVANTAKSITAINGSQLTWSTVNLAEYYLRITISGGTPAISGTYNDNVNEYGFVVQDITYIQLPVGVSVADTNIGVEVSI